MICSKRAVSSACRWVCSAIFSLNFLGFAMIAFAVHNWCTAARLQQARHKTRRRFQGRFQSISQVALIRKSAQFSADMSPEPDERLFQIDSGIFFRLADELSRNGSWRRVIEAFPELLEYVCGAHETVVRPLLPCRFLNK